MMTELNTQLPEENPRYDIGIDSLNAGSGVLTQDSGVELVQDDLLTASMVNEAVASAISSARAARRKEADLIIEERKLLRSAGIRPTF